MAKTVTLQVDGQNVTLESSLVSGYLRESKEHLDNIAEETAELKLVAESLEGACNGAVKASIWLKYLKTRYKNKTKEATELGELFGAIDSVLEG